MNPTVLEISSNSKGVLAATIFIILISFLALSALPSNGVNPATASSIFEASVTNFLTARAAPVTVAATPIFAILLSGCKAVSALFLSFSSLDVILSVTAENLSIAVNFVDIE